MVYIVMVVTNNFPIYLKSLQQDGNMPHNRNIASCSSYWRHESLKRIYSYNVTKPAQSLYSKYVLFYPQISTPCIKENCTYIVDKPID